MKALKTLPGTQNTLSKSKIFFCYYYCLIEIQPSCHNLRDLATAYFSNLFSYHPPLPLTLLGPHRLPRGRIFAPDLCKAGSLSFRFLTCATSSGKPFCSSFLKEPSTSTPTSSHHRIICFIFFIVLFWNHIVYLLFICLLFVSSTGIRRQGSYLSGSLLNSQTLDLGLAQNRCPIDNYWTNNWMYLLVEPIYLLTCWSRWPFLASQHLALPSPLLSPLCSSP